MALGTAQIVQARMNSEIEHNVTLAYNKIYFIFIYGLSKSSIGTVLHLQSYFAGSYCAGCSKLHRLACNTALLKALFKRMSKVKFSHPWLLKMSGII